MSPDIKLVNLQEALSKQLPTEIYDNINSLQEKSSDYYQKIKDCTHNVRDVVNVYRNKNEYYNIRADIVRDRFKCLSHINYISYLKKELVKNITIVYKSKQRSDIASGSAYVLTNDTERKAFYEYDTSVLDYAMKELDEHVKNLIEYQKQIESILYNLETFMKMEDRYKNLA